MMLWAFAAYAACFALTLAFIADVAERRGVKSRLAMLLLSMAWPLFWVAVLVSGCIRRSQQ